MERPGRREVALEAETCHVGKSFGETIGGHADHPVHAACDQWQGQVIITTHYRNHRTIPQDVHALQPCFRWLP